MLSNLRLPHGTPIDRAKQKKSEILTVPLILIFLLWVGIACAQSTFGRIRGTAQDSSDAALPDMQITLESVDKKTDRTVKTDGAPAALKGVAAAAVGLILSTVVGLSKKSLAGKFDFVFMALTVIAVNRLHQSVPRTLLVVGLLAILFHRPRNEHKETVKP